MLLAEILAIGSEMLTPYRVDTNSLFLARSLEEHGIRLIAKSVIGDDETLLASAFRIALSRADIVICSGGLGPTVDDLTREALATALELPLRLDPGALAAIENRFRSRRMHMPASNQKQAMVPEGGHVLENPLGSAPGLYIEAQNRQIFLLPGPPHELEAMWNDRALPLLRKGSPLHRNIFRVAMLGESHVDELLKPVTQSLTHTQYTILASPSEIEIHLMSSAEHAAEREKAAEQVRQILGRNIYAEELVKLEQVVGGLLIKGKKTVALAESCTGGFTAHRITDVPGSSAYMERGVVVYSNIAKTEMLGVPPELIQQHGAVSREVAAAMAEGIQKTAGATFGIGITGIAGPDGGSAEKPVGTVFVALAEEGQETIVQKYNFPAERPRVKFMSSQAALNMLRLRLLESL